MTPDRRWAMTDDDRDAEFDSHYFRLSLLGACDSPGGAEYRRVFSAWIAAKRPPIVTFIRQTARKGVEA